VDCFNFFLVSTRLVNANSRLIVLRLFLKPHCSSSNVSLFSTQKKKRLLRTAQYILYTDEANAMPLYAKGSLGSEDDDFGIGFIIHLPQIEGTIPLSKHVTCSGWVRVVGICVCPPFLMITSCIYPIPH